MKLPYGVSDFEKLITGGYYYCDRTDRIPLLEEAGDYLLFIRPRRFGKSLLLSMLQNYYDLGRKDRFETNFGDLKIGANPTSLRGRYFILKLDFSCIDSTGEAADIRRALHNHVNTRIQGFYKFYKSVLNAEKIDSNDAISSLQSLFSAVQRADHPLYLLIDEYDNFANEVMMDVRDERDQYKTLVHERGPLKTLFKAVKSGAADGGVDRIFITGVSPVVMSDMTSGFNIAENIFMDPDFNDLCGFTESETEEILNIAVSGFDKEEDTKKALALMRTYYNGYTFAPESETPIYNPTLAIYFLKAFQKLRKYPRKMLDANLATDETKLAYVAGVSGGKQMILDITRDEDPVIVSDIVDRFGIQEMLNDKSKDQAFLASFLYYFGALTLAGETAEGELVLKAPNLVMRGLYIDRLQKMLLPEPGDRDNGGFAAKQLRGKGDMAPLCEFVERRYFKVFHNPDYRWANELTVKTAFLTLLYNDRLYIMDSEDEVERGRADLTMIIRPDMRRYNILDILIEFKYVKLGDAGLTGEKARELPSKELEKIPPMIASMKDAEEQLRRYGGALEKKYGNLRLRRYAVVSLGFERIWWKEV